MTPSIPGFRPSFFRYLLIPNGVQDGDIDVGGNGCVNEGLAAIPAIWQGEREDLLELDDRWRSALELGEIIWGEDSHQACRSRWHRGFRLMTCAARDGESFAAGDGSR